MLDLQLELELRVKRLKVLRENQKRFYKFMKRYKKNDFVQEVSQQTKGVIEGLSISISTMEEILMLMNNSKNQLHLKVVNEHTLGSLFIVEEGTEERTT